MSHLSLSFFDDTKSDALQSLSITSPEGECAATLNAKALYRAAKASYHLGWFEESDSFLLRSEELAPEDQARVQLRKSIRVREREQRDGVYNFAKTRERIQHFGTVDVAGCVTKVESRSSPGSNGPTGFLAIGDIRAGDIVLCEKAYAAASPEDAQSKQADIVMPKGSLHGKYQVALRKNMVDKAVCNKSTLNQLHRFFSEDPKLTAGTNVFTLNRVAARAAMLITHSSKDSIIKKTGLYAQALGFNQSCMPNTATGFIGDLVAYPATRDIKADEQIFNSYAELYDDYGKSPLAQHFKAEQKGSGSQCNCDLCAAEDRTSSADRSARV